MNTSSDSLPPATPRKGNGGWFDAKLQSIAIEFGLSITPRDGVSPSGRKKTDAEICVRSVHFLYCQDRKLLEDTLQQFRDQLKGDSVRGDPLKQFLTLLENPVNKTKMANGKKFTTMNGSPVSNRFVSNSAEQEMPSTPSSRHNPSRLKPKTIPSALRQSTLCWPSAKISRSQPKDSTSKKRPSDSDENMSDTIKHFRMEQDDGMVPSLPRIISQNTSFQSIATSASRSATTSFSTSIRNLSNPSTPASSIPSQSDQCDDYGEFNPSQIDEIISPDQKPIVSENTSLIQRTNENFDSQRRGIMHRADSGNDEADAQLQAEHRAQIKRSNLRSGLQVKTPPETCLPPNMACPAPLCPTMNVTPSTDRKASRKISEHYLARDLPRHGLFSEPFPASLSALPLPVRWEYMRVAKYLSMTLEELTRYPIENADDLYKLLELRGDKAKTFNKTPSAELKNYGDTVKPMSVVYKGKLSLTPPGSRRKYLYNMDLCPLNSDKTSRLQRAFGAHRFLYLDVPSFDGLDSEIRKTIPQRFCEWLCTEKEFLGCKWRAFHVQPIKRQQKLPKDCVGGQRVLMFATDGYGVEPSVSLRQLLDWIVPVEQNGGQPYTKAFARIDLSLSQTTPTVRFSSSQVRFVDDTKADTGSRIREDDTFSDPALRFASGVDVFNRPVMNDGCSLMSVGAARQICNSLGLSGMRPVSFQGRINGCKGMWSISAPYDSTNTQDQDVWIEITKSQQKVVPRPQDLDDSTCGDRWTFELVKYSKPPSKSNLYLEFMPILENRHVPSDVICEIVSTQMEMDFQDLYDTLEESADLKRWIFSQGAFSKGEKRSSGIAIDGAFPDRIEERIIMLLDHGFHIKSCLQLKKCFEQFLTTWVRQLQERLKVQLPRSTMVYGIADPTGCLKPGEIYLRFSESFEDDTTGDVWSFLSGEVLVARHPSLRRSDIQKVKAVYKEELSHLRDVVVFPTQGSRPLADKLQGGDYDGDTFWLCWDGRITKPFMNAPAPLAQTNLQNFFIKKDKRTLKEITGPDMNVDNWLALSLQFKQQEDLLGQVTNLFRRLSYKENDISSPSVTALADLHDVIIDSAKNGYTFDMEAFIAFKKKWKIKEPKKPAYEEYLGVSDDKSATGSSKARYNPNHIIDRVLFEVVTPRINAMKAEVKKLLSTADSNDADLADFYRAQKEQADEVTTKVLTRLTSDLDAVTKRWGRTVRPDVDCATEKSRQEFQQCLSECFDLYRAIQPSLPDETPPQHPTRHWATPRLSNEPATWDLVKASTLYYIRHMKRARYNMTFPTLVFHVAGIELCYIKAMSQKQDGTRVLTQNMYTRLKPSKEKKPKQVKEMAFQTKKEEGDFESSESEEMEFFDAPE